jgi:protein SCO1/2
MRQPSRRPFWKELPMHTTHVLRRGAIRSALFLVAAAVALLVAACSRPHTFNGTVYDPVIPAPELKGTNWDGSPFALSDLRGKVVLLFFGYTNCPDICPTSLADMKSVKQRLGDKAEDVAVVFVSVDPERDTPERLAQYIPAFDPTFYGVTMTEAELQQAKKDYGVFAEKRELDPSQSAASYLVDHTAWVYAIDKEGQQRVVFSMDLDNDQRTQDVDYLLRQ